MKWLLACAMAGCLLAAGCGNGSQSTTSTSNDAGKRVMDEQTAAAKSATEKQVEIAAPKK